MRYKTISYDFHCAFTSEDDGEYDFDFFLKRESLRFWNKSIVDVTRNSLIAVESPFGMG